MQLLERYLQTIRAFLSGSDQDDIIQELRANLLAQIEDKESSLGRTLTENEVEAILQSHGHPVLVAARYSPARYLIGPVVFPFFWVGVKAIALFGAFLSLLALLQGLSQGSLGEVFISQILLIPVTFLKIALPLFALLTLAGAIADQILNRSNCLGKWCAKDLPPLKEGKPHIEGASNKGLAAAAMAAGFSQCPKHPHSPQKSQKASPPPSCSKPTCGHHHNPRLEAFGHLLCHLLFLGWYFLLPYYPWLVFGPAYDQLQFTQAVSLHYWPVASLLMLGASAYSLALIFPIKGWLLPIIEVFNSGLSLLIIHRFLHVGNLLWLTNPNTAPEALVTVVNLINRYYTYPLYVACVLLPLCILAKLAKLTWKASQS